jgi:hypothetical protein|tara:strand:+ start:110 stop:460 length:351 start_codon:yes stop_codon:yes gene_type:complete
MSWTTPGQGHNLNEVKMSKFKFKMNSKRDQEGQGPAKGVVVTWQPSDRESIQISAPEPLTPVHKQVIKDITKGFAGQYKMKVNGTVVDPGRKDKNYTDYRPGWSKAWSPVLDPSNK